MSTVIKVENLSKRYRLGLKESRKDTLMGQIAQTLRAPLDNLKRLRSMTRFDEEDESVFWALRDINFEVKQGEVLGIIGHNGAGKSTLLKILSRITEPTDGRILINGRIAALLEVGTGFHQDLTGRENIYMNGTILGMTRREIDRKLDEIVDFSGVEKHLDTPVKFYSSGMKVRLGFAVAAHLEPEILIIDEVLAVGDAEFQRKCLGKMEAVASTGRTVLFVSHNMLAVRQLCPITLLLQSGGKKLVGKTDEVIDFYLFKGQSNRRHKDIDGIRRTGLIDIQLLSNEGEELHEIANEEDIFVGFLLEKKSVFDTISIGFTIFDESGNPILSSILSDSKMSIPQGRVLLKSRISVANLNTGCFYLEYSFNGKNLENAVQFEKVWCKSKFVMDGNNSKSKINFTDWTYEEQKTQ